MNKSFSRPRIVRGPDLLTRDLLTCTFYRWTFYQADLLTGILLGPSTGGPSNKFIYKLRYNTLHISPRNLGGYFTQHIM